MPLSKKPKVFYGYWIVLTAFFCLFLVSGCGFYAFSLFVRPLQAEFGWGRGGIMAAWTVLFLLSGMAAPFIGRLIDRYGTRKIIAIGAFITGLGFVLLSQMNSLWYLYIGHALIGGGHAAIGPVPTSTMVSNWFKKRRGLSIGIMSTGVGAGGFVLAPLIGGYLIPNFGWRVSYLALALITWTLIPLALLVVRTKPADMGLSPDGIEDTETIARAKSSLPASSGLSLKIALATSTFWLIAVSFLAGNFGAVGTVQNQVPHLEDIGFSVAMAATALGAVALGSLFGKFGFGWLCDQIQANYAWGISLGLMLAGTIILMSMGPESPLAIVWLYAVVTGLGHGGWLPTMSMIVSTNFGLAAYGTIFGLITLAHGIGGATGPLFGGYMYDLMGSYRWAFIIFLALYAVAIPATLAVRRPKSVE
ncbi:MFS transporter [Chloroflexota bacterium]